VLLTRRSAGRVTVIAAIDSPQTLRVVTDAARDQPLPVGSFGKLHMAWLRDAELDVLLGRADDGADRASLRATLAAIRSQGHARSDGEVEPGMSSLSVPILVGGDTLLAALTLAAPTFRLPNPIARRLLPMLQDAARRIGELWQSEPVAEAGRRAAP
jgi:DNA-binding IclR family transcriptional regulator